MNKLDKKRQLNDKRKASIRKKVSGTEERPRLSVFRSLNHIYCQLINDVDSKTVALLSSKDKSLGLKSGGNIATAEQVGKAMGEKIKNAGVKKIVFDRNGKAYHGRVKAVAEGIRSCGIDF